MKYVSIDVETTGLDPDTCQILEFGAVIEDTDNKLPLDQLPTFQRYLRHRDVFGNPYALAMNHEILSRIANSNPNDPDVCKPGDLGVIFARWLSKHGLNSGAITVAGKNFGGFDFQFLKRLEDFTPWPVPIKHRTLDPGTLFFNPATDQSPPDLKTCMERAYPTGGSFVVEHRAVEDALAVIVLLRKGIGY